MALSYYSNWGPLQPTTMEPDIVSMLLDPATPPPELLPELQPFPDVDHLFEPPPPTDSFYPENPNPLLYDFANGILQEPFSVQQEFDPSFFNYPKRQKESSEYHQECEGLYSDENLFKRPSLFMNGLVQNPSCPVQEYYSPSLPEFPTAPPLYTTGSCGGESLKKDATEAGSSNTLSAQSIAARQRRRKITEKTQELGKLVPGGQKMNTAEMLQSAYKYIKYMQAQVRILEYIDSYDHQEESSFGSHNEELMQVLLGSPLILEKLYSNEKCIVPQKFVDELCGRSDNRIVESNPELLSLTVKQEH